MASRRVLVVYFSRAGHTRTVARALRTAFAADVEEIRDRADRRGVVGYLRCAAEALLGTSTEIELPAKDPSTYDLVLVGGPVWTASVCSPIRTYLWLQRDRLPAVGLFVTYGGAGSERALSRTSALLPRRPVATVAIREAEVAAGKHEARVTAFVEALADRSPRKRHRRARAASA